ncbi:Hypothetical protein, putative, partial [Bodo saltans]
KTQVDALRIHRKDLISFVCREVLYEYLNSTAAIAAANAAAGGGGGGSITHVPSTTAHHDVLYQLLKYLALRYARQTGTAPEFSTFGLEFGLLSGDSGGGLGGASLGASFGGAGGVSGRRRSVATSSLSRGRSSLRPEGSVGASRTASSRLTSFYSRTRSNSLGGGGSGVNGSFSAEGAQPLWFVVLQSLLTSVVATIRKLLSANSSGGGGGTAVTSASTASTDAKGGSQQQELVGGGGRRQMVNPGGGKDGSGGGKKPIPPPAARHNSLASAITPRPSSPKGGAPASGRPLPFATSNNADHHAPTAPSTPRPKTVTTINSGPDGSRHRPSSARVMRNPSPLDDDHSYISSHHTTGGGKYPQVKKIELIRVGSMCSDDSAKSSSHSVAPMHPLHHHSNNTTANTSSSSSNYRRARGGDHQQQHHSSQHHSVPVGGSHSCGGNSNGNKGEGAQTILHQFLVEAIIAKGPPHPVSSTPLIDRGDSMSPRGRSGTPRDGGSGMGEKTQYLPVKHKKPSGGLGHTPRGSK